MGMLPGLQIFITHSQCLELPLKRWPNKFKFILCMDQSYCSAIKRNLIDRNICEKSVAFWNMNHFQIKSQRCVRSIAGLQLTVAFNPLSFITVSVPPQPHCQVGNDL